VKNLECSPFLDALQGHHHRFICVLDPFTLGRDDILERLLYLEAAGAGVAIVASTDDEGYESVVPPLLEYLRARIQMKIIEHFRPHPEHGFRRAHADSYILMTTVANSAAPLYAGRPAGACLAEVGNEVLCLDLDAQKVAELQQGQVRIYEPGLEQLVRTNLLAGRLRFTSDVAAAVAFGTIQVIAVGTPRGEDGSADLQYVLAAARNIGRHMNGLKLIVTKSTVPVGTGDRIVEEELRHRGSVLDFDVASNPEFLKEGAAIADFTRPERIVIGAASARATAWLRALYAPFQRNHERLVIMDVRSAELTKYAANAMLATRMSFMNEMANLADAVGADIEQVRLGIGADHRIGYHFLYAGTGYGGSCFPKDVRALRKMGEEAGVPPLRASAPRRSVFRGLAFLRVGMMACAAREAMVS
jgi:hypothetical protein